MEKEKNGYAKYFQYLENQEIDNAISTLKRIQQLKEQDTKDEDVSIRKNARI